MTKLGRPRSERMAEAVRRVLAGESCYAVAKSLGMFAESVSRGVRQERERLAAANRPAADVSAP